MTLVSISNADRAGLQVAINQAIGSDGIVTFDPGIATIELDGQELIIDGNVTIEGANRITLDGKGLSRIFSVQSGIVTIKELTVANGSVNNERGGGIFNEGDLTLDGVTVTGNQIQNSVQQTGSNAQNNLQNADDVGAGIFNEAGATLTLSSSIVSNNQIVRSNGAIDGNGPGIRNNGTLAFDGENNFIFGNTPADDDEAQIAGTVTGDQQPNFSEPVDTPKLSIAAALRVAGGDNEGVDQLAEGTGDNPVTEVVVTVTSEDKSGLANISGAVEVVIGGTNVDGNALNTTTQTITFNDESSGSFVIPITETLMRKTMKLSHLPFKTLALTLALSSIPKIPRRL